MDKSSTPKITITATPTEGFGAVKKYTGNPEGDWTRLPPLERVMKTCSIGEWISTPNPAFYGLTPQEIIDSGDADRIIDMIYRLQTGG